MKLSEIQDLVKFVAKSGVCEVELQTKDVKIIIKTKNEGNKTSGATVISSGSPAINTIAAPVAAPPQIQTSAPAPVAGEKKAADKPAAADDDSKYLIVKSPMIGTFYRSSSPDKPPFVNIGDEIKEGSPVCIIEAMKLFNEIESDVKGKIVKVLVNDATPVEYDQPLFLVDPN